MTWSMRMPRRRGSLASGNSDADAKTLVKRDLLVRPIWKKLSMEMWCDAPK